MSDPSTPLPSDDFDARWLLRLQAGDTAAFDAVYDAYRARVFGFVLRLSGQADQAEELCQEIWLRLARDAHRLKPDTRLLPWLLTVGRNLVFSQHRRRRLEGGILQWLGWRTGSTTVECPLATLEHREAHRRLELALAGLPMDQREALLLVAVEQLDAQTAAAVVGISPAAFRQRLSRARAGLRTVLDKQASGSRNVD